MMKLYKFSFLMLGALFTLSSCNDIDEQEPLGGSLTKAQNQETVAAVPERAEATFSGMFTMMAKPCNVYGTSNDRADDAGFFTIMFSGDLEAADMVGVDNDYNWFSVACELSTRNADYANPYIRYKTPYNQIGIANEVIASWPAATTDPDGINQVAQARAMRAFDYLTLVPMFAFPNKLDDPCVPILKDGVDYANNPRATVKEVLDYVMEDLDYAVDHLYRLKRSDSDKQYIDKSVAFGLRARANLYLQNWAAAAADADSAMVGYEPASIEDVSKPAFCNMDESNWMWGISMNKSLVDIEPYATSASWLCSFSANGYGAACQDYVLINSMLYNKIPSTDIRKQWWVDENLHSDNMTDVTWDDSIGDGVSTLQIPDVKEAFLPYTNVKFGMKAGIGSEINTNDIPLMRVEEMYLIKAEGLAKSGKEADAIKVLNDFVSKYRDPSYKYDEATSPRSLEDEIWFQRRVELWGEGFATPDTKRLGKPVVRFHGADTSNWPSNFTFNIASDDGWLNMRFPTREKNNNSAIVDNQGGAQPELNQNPTLRDGVTD